MKKLQGLRQRILTGWNIMRLLRLALALFITISAVVAADGLLMAGGAFLLGQALLNVGCCGINGCAVNPEYKPVAKAENTVE